MFKTAVVQPAAFTLTKIQPPRMRANLVAREALERRLGESLASRPLTLLSAPAGFGKTAALTRQVHLLPSGTPLAWIAADDDDDLHRFLVCLFAALEPFDLPWRAAPDALIAAAVNARGERRNVAAQLLNALAACDVARGLIVVDDAHRIADRGVFEFIDLLLERLPAHWGWVISSRVDPPLALARLRARDDVLELRQSDLCFDADEVAALAATHGGGDAAQLLRHTGGWPAGLRLALNAWQQGAPGATAINKRRMNRDMFDYLAAEVLDDMPGALRDFLLRCSVLPELTAARCAAVSGDSRAAHWLDEIERRGLFVSVLDGPEPALTLHELLRACLHERLRRDYPGEVSALLRRAADTEPDPIRRLTFLMRAAAWHDAEIQLEQVAERLLADGAIEPALRLVEQFPAERREQSPLLALVRGLTAWERWDWRALADAMRRAAAGFDAVGDTRRACRAQVFEAIALLGNGWIPESRARLDALSLEDADIETRALALALRTWQTLDSGDFRAVAPCCLSVLDALEQCDRLQIWSCFLQRTLYVWLPGMGAPLSRLVDGITRRSGDTPSQMRAIAHVMAAWLALWRGELAQAMERVAQAQDDARWLGMPTRLRMFIHTVLAALHAVRGERDPAQRSIEELLAYFASAPASGPVEQPTSMLGHYLFYAARLTHTLGDEAMLRTFVARVPPPAQIKNYDVLRVPLATLPPRLAALDGRHDEACALWTEVLANEAAIDVIGLAEETRLRYADSLLALGRLHDAAAVLKPVLKAVADNGEIGGVLFAGREVLVRLAATAWRDELAWTELAMLRGWAQRFGDLAPPPLSVADDGPLSAREIEVLARIAAGDSNKVIARALDLSPHTVKRHVANILDKLGLESRGQAAQWYRTRHIHV